KTLVQTQYGFHIVRRNLLPEVRSKFVEKLTEDNVVTQQNAFIAKLRSDWKVEARPGAVAKIRDVAKQPMNARGDKTALYTSRMGDFTAARLAQWLDVIPPQAGIRERLASPQMPDSMVLNLVRSLVDQEVLGAEADKQGIKVDTLEVKQIRSYFGRMVKSAMMGLRVDPSLLADSAKTDGEKEKVAAARVDDALDAIFASNGQGMVEITPQVASALRSRYSFRVNSAGVDRAVERAMAIRASADSARAKEMPPAGSGAGLPPGAVPVPVPPGVRGRGGR
ncbi:MAG TPA: hypothetical protein VE967_15405, partial [Gemmatimonadaceae bacterium]|nr:hypothetical protein [Gemmatimonadaceae bacterium]